MNPYEVLGVPPGAPLAEARRAYVALARRHHPDRWAAGSAAERDRALRRMQEVNEAWAAIASGVVPPRPEEARGFRPFDADVDEPDPRDAPDVPYRPAPARTSRRSAATVAPAALFAAAVVAGALGVVLGATALWTLAVVLFLLACLGFVAVPLMALGAAARDE